ncbi:hypothetical protein WT08_00190 [Burkholderia sp. MSMB1552]|nr:hypothetical protein WT08_00190 [Burkholderia sp. MSMB1552]KWZ50470.1 hypothetical protein WS92_24060 [Burkholderia sp. MSMB1588]
MHTISFLIVILRRDKVIEILQSLEVGDILAVTPQIWKFRRHADDEMLTLSVIVFTHDSKCCG